MTSRTRLPRFDKYRHYRECVQAPARHMRFLDRVYREARGSGSVARTLREDFCGSFANCCAWIKLDAARLAIGVDLDPEPIEYGCTRHWARLKPFDQARIRIIEGNVLSPDLPSADLIVALNFSYWIFKQRTELLDYFRNCRRTLEPDGAFVLDVLGGPELQKASTDSRIYEDEDYTYFFEQEGFDPLSHEARFHMHFQRQGEERRSRVFTYDWRVWTVAEVKDALLEAGFAGVRTYWEATTDEGAGGGTWKLIERVGAETETWASYLVGLR